MKLFCEHRSASEDWTSTTDWEPLLICEVPDDAIERFDHPYSFVAWQVKNHGIYQYKCSSAGSHRLEYRWTVSTFDDEGSPLIKLFERINPKVAEKLALFNIYQRNYIIAKFRYDKLLEKYQPVKEELRDRYLRNELSQEELLKTLNDLEESNGEVMAWDLYSESEKLLLEWGKERILKIAKSKGEQEFQKAKEHMEIIFANLHLRDIREDAINLFLKLDDLNEN